MVTTFSWRKPSSWSLLLLCLLLAGCSTRVVYYWLDVAIVWQLDDYFSLDRGQKRLLDNEVKGLMAWHRQREVPRYADDLDALAKAVASPMTPAQVTLHLDRTQASLTRTLENAIPRTVRLASTLTDAQVARFEFRAVRPTFDLQPFSVHGKPSADGKTVELWAQDHEGWLTMQGQATLA